MSILTAGIAGFTVATAMPQITRRKLFCTFVFLYF